MKLFQPQMANLFNDHIPHLKHSLLLFPTIASNFQWILIPCARFQRELSFQNSNVIQRGYFYYTNLLSPVEQSNDEIIFTLIKQTSVEK